MNLSAIAQYYIRKLLQKYLENLNCLLVAASGSASLTDLNPVLARFYAQSSTSKVVEVETLIRLHQAWEAKREASRECAGELERRILGLLGFQLGSIASSRLPLVKPESLFPTFRFHSHGRIREGLRHDNELYGLVHEFRINPRFHAYQLACVLLERHIPCVVTTSKTRCALWVPLRSAAYPILACYNDGVSGSLMFVHSKLCKLRQTAAQRRIAEHVLPVASSVQSVIALSPLAPPQKFSSGPAEKLAAEKLAAEKLAAEKLAVEKLAAEKLAAESRASGNRVRSFRASENQAVEKPPIPESMLKYVLVL